MPRTPTHATARHPTPPIMPPMTRPARDALLAQARTFVMENGPAGTARDIERTATVIAEKIEACWDFEGMR